MVKIYSLKDPITNEIRYVGKTVQSLQKRLNQHLCSKKEHNTYKFRWLSKLKEQNLKPIIELLEECTDTEWVEAEKSYIQTLPNLTNLTQGGENGIFFTKEILDKISKGVKEKHKDKTYSDNLKRKRVEYWSNKDNRIKRSLLMKSRNIKLTDDHKLILCIIKKTQWQNKTYRDQMSNQSKSLWENNEYRITVLNYLQSDEHKKNVSNRFKGITLSDEHKQKMSLSRKNKKPVSIDNVIYESITNASIETGINRDCIKSRLKSKNFNTYFFI